MGATGQTRQWMAGREARGGSRAAWSLGVVGLVALLVATGMAQSPAAGQGAPVSTGEAKLGSSVRRVESGGTFTNKLGMRMVYIAPGEFLMGSKLKPAEVVSRYGGKEDFHTDEHPQHEVRLTRGFYLGRTEVTVGEFRKFVAATDYKTEAERGGQDFEDGRKGGRVWDDNWQWNVDATWRNPGFGQTDDHPVVMVTWGDAKAFCQWLSKTEGKPYRLPTEAEWEYACRAGTTTEYWWGDSMDDTGKVANVGDSGHYTPGKDYKTMPMDDEFSRTSPVGRYRPNPWGLCDMIGNVWEWCEDWTSPYADQRQVDPEGAATGKTRMTRGGSWCNNAESSRSPIRMPHRPAGRDSSNGFRVAMSADGTPPPAPGGPTVAQPPVRPEAAQPPEREAAQPPRQGSGAQPPRNFTNPIGMKMVLVPAGEFRMGSKLKSADVVARFGGKEGDHTDELPAHEVRITNPFYMSSTEVTVAQFRRFVEATSHRTSAERGGQTTEDGKKGGRIWEAKWIWDQDATWRDPKYAQKDDFPVVMVSWEDATAFCEWMTKSQGRRYRLPTEAEWEYACRAGGDGEFWWGDSMDDTGKVGNVADTGQWSTPSQQNKLMPMDDRFSVSAPVGTYRANPLGLYDTIGNVWEWCQDRYGAYSEDASADPTGASTGSLRIIRGGSWYSDADACRCAFRSNERPDNRAANIGFRVAADPTR